jgi:hypothetical protein
MKELLLVVLLIGASALGLQARDVTFAWDPNPTTEYVTAYGVQYKIGPAGEWLQPVMVTSGDANSPYDVPVQLNFPEFPDVLCYVRVFARNSDSDGDFSVELAVPIRPGAVKGFLFKIERKTAQLSFQGEGQLAIQQSTDLIRWWDIATASGVVEIGTAVDISTFDRSFFRGISG